MRALAEVISHTWTGAGPRLWGRSYPCWTISSFRKTRSPHLTALSILTHDSVTELGDEVPAIFWATVPGFSWSSIEQPHQSVRFQFPRASLRRPRVVNTLFWFWCTWTLGFSISLYVHFCLFLPHGGWRKVNEHVLYNYLDVAVLQLNKEKPVPVPWPCSRPPSPCSCLQSAQKQEPEEPAGTEIKEK